MVKRKGGDPTVRKKKLEEVVGWHITEP